MAIRESAYFRALQTALHGAGVPYGYAVTVWASGAALAGEHGIPSEGEIALFATGATIGYGGLRLLTWETKQEADTPLPRSPNLFRAGVVHVTAMAAAISAALLIAHLRGSAAWILATLASTLLYLAVSSVEVATVERDGGGSSGAG